MRSTRSAVPTRTGLLPAPSRGSARRRAVAEPVRTEEIQSRLDALLDLSADDLLTMIRAHIADRDFEAVVALLHLLAVKDPEAAQTILTTVEALSRG